MKGKDIPDIPCDYHGNDWHEQFFAGNTTGVGFRKELLSPSFYTLRTDVHMGLRDTSHTEDSAIENCLFIDVLFPLNEKTLRHLLFTSHLHSPIEWFLSQLMTVFATVTETHLVFLVNCCSTFSSLLYLISIAKLLYCWLHAYSILKSYCNNLFWEGF